jgi:tetratricopeptide (TPR) repeat protein
LAHHALRGEVWDKALAYYRQAGAKAMAGSANREAVACFEHALQALQHLPDSGALREQAIDVRFDLRNALFPLEEHERILAHLRDAETLAAELNDHRRLGQIYTYMASAFWLMGNHEGAATLSQNALSLAEAGGDVTLEVMANYRLGQAHYWLGDYRRVIDHLRRNVTLLEGELLYQRFGMVGLPAVLSRTFLVQCLAECGEFVQGIADGEDAVRIAEAVDHPFSLAHVYGAVGRLNLYRGELDNAIAVLERGLELCRVWSFPVLFPHFAAALSHAYTLSGQVATALSLLEQVMQLHISRGMVISYSLSYVWLGEAYILAGRLAEARHCAERALALSRERRERGNQTYALRFLGEIAAHHHAPDVESAEAHYRQALALAEELGMRPLQAHCHYSLGSLYRQVGRAPQARAELSAAIDLYRDMQMTFWLPQAEQRLAEVGG